MPIATGLLALKWCNMAEPKIDERTKKEAVQGQ